jgi:hypothetical protein
VAEIMHTEKKGISAYVSLKKLSKRIFDEEKSIAQDELFFCSRVTAIETVASIILKTEYRSLTNYILR